MQYTYLFSAGIPRRSFLPYFVTATPSPRVLYYVTVTRWFMLFMLRFLNWLFVCETHDFTFALPSAIFIRSSDGELIHFEIRRGNGFYLMFVHAFSIPVDEFVRHPVTKKWREVWVLHENKLLAAMWVYCGDFVLTSIFFVVKIRVILLLHYF